MSDGRTVWLSQNVLDELDEKSRQDESPNACLERLLEVGEWRELNDRIREVVRDEVATEALR